ncbi:hypothetical protein CBR_g21998 [Chara braunii]|uniref:Uncharacterized protein n=1 Tax=Chara braunii TaxID=69332 RepID=A0A388L1R1_CHABU|nr:hypothetical protein CBR_g21998 [Chara braunii]|eukprot:GBG76250.1 hypothetical protein CBR_g21998 [Chara braunii]
MLDVCSSIVAHVLPSLNTHFENFGHSFLELRSGNLCPALRRILRKRRVATFVLSGQQTFLLRKRRVAILRTINP